MATAESNGPDRVWQPGNMSAGGPSTGGAQESFADLFLRLWSRSDDVAVIGRYATWTGRELLARAGGADGWLRSQGARRGTPVPALVRTSPAAVALAVAGSLNGIPMAPLNPKTTAYELQQILTGLDAQLLVVDAEVQPLAEELVGRVPDLHYAVVPAEFKTVETWQPAPGPTGVVLHTSGSTGVPKRVDVAQLPLAARSTAYAAPAGFRKGDVYCSASPFHHVAGVGMCFVALGCGGAIVTVPWFSIEEWMWLRAVRPTHVLLVPAMIERLLRADALDAGMGTVIYGGSPIDEDTLREALQALPNAKLVQIFGQTEGSPLTTLTHDDHLAALAGRPELLGSAGRAVTDVELRLEDVDDDGVGEVVARGPHLFQGDADGWLRTGDLGIVAADGYLYLRGRRGDMIIRGGENIYPLEVERVLVLHPDVCEAAVVGVPDRQLGQLVRAVVVPADPEAPPTVEALAAFARQHLPGFKVPVDWRFVPELPRTVTGKLQRGRLA